MRVDFGSGDPIPDGWFLTGLVDGCIPYAVVRLPVWSHQAEAEFYIDATTARWRQFAVLLDRKGDRWRIRFRWMPTKDSPTTVVRAIDALRRA